MFKNILQVNSGYLLHFIAGSKPWYDGLSDKLFKQYPPIKDNYLTTIRRGTFNYNNPLIVELNTDLSVILICYKPNVKSPIKTNAVMESIKNLNGRLDSTKTIYTSNSYSQEVLDLLSSFNNEVVMLS